MQKVDEEGGAADGGDDPDGQFNRRENAARQGIGEQGEDGPEQDDGRQKDPVVAADHHPGDVRADQTDECQ